MMTIHKFQLHSGPNSVLMPAGALPLCVHEQEGGLFLWARVNTEAPMSSLAVYVIGTGYELPPGALDLDYFGTIHMQCGLVWHVFA